MMPFLEVGGQHLRKSWQKYLAQSGVSKMGRRVEDSQEGGIQVKGLDVVV